MTSTAILAAARCPRCYRVGDDAGHVRWIFCPDHGCGAVRRDGQRCGYPATYPALGVCGVHLTPAVITAGLSPPVAEVPRE
jgi:hypothetical protein